MASIVLIDDDVDFASILQTFLTFIGHRVESTNSGQAGLILLARQPPPDLLISDLVMPDIDGPTLLNQLYRREHCFPCRVIAISGGGRIGSTSVYRAIDHLPVDAVLHKPFDPNMLEQHILDMGLEPG